MSYRVPKLTKMLMNRLADQYIELERRFMQGPQDDGALFKDLCKLLNDCSRQESLLRNVLCRIDKKKTDRILTEVDIIMPDHLDGEKVECPKCGTEFDIDCPLDDLISHRIDTLRARSAKRRKPNENTPLH